MFGRNKYNTPVVIFRQSPDGFTKVNSSAMFMIIKGNRRLKLKSGLVISADSTSKVGNTFYTFTPDEKVYFPIKFSLLGNDVIQRIKKYESEHIDEFQKIDEDPTISLEEKAQKKKEIMRQALSPDENHLLDKYGISFDIIPDQAAYEILQQQIEEANRIKAQKKQTTLERLMPVVMVVGMAIGFAIIAYATANYNSAVSSSAVRIVSSMQQIVTSLHSVVTAIGGSATHAVNSTIPAP